jgi:hypothetical protein
VIFITFLPVANHGLPARIGIVLPCLKDEIFMDSNEKIIPANSPSRRKFVWGLGIFSAFAAVAAATDLPFFAKKLAKTDGKKRTVKMLTEDGRLVEINESLITASKKKVTNAELQHWIKK